MFLHNKDIDPRQIIHFISNDIQLDPLPLVKIMANPQDISNHCAKKEL